MKIKFRQFNDNSSMALILCLLILQSIYASIA